jgi:hypothetical protein
MYNTHTYIWYITFLCILHKWPTVVHYILWWHFPYIARAADRVHYYRSRQGSNGLSLEWKVIKALRSGEWNGSCIAIHVSLLMMQPNVKCSSLPLSCAVLRTFPVLYWRLPRYIMTVLLIPPFCGITVSGYWECASWSGINLKLPGDEWTMR